jgi:hypothetical protein
MPRLWIAASLAEALSCLAAISGQRSRAADGTWADEDRPHVDDAQDRGRGRGVSQ